MSSKSKAAKAKAPKIPPLHRSAWRSMRILRDWTIPGVVRTIPGATVAGVTRYVKALQRHAIVETVPGHQPGRGGEHQRYRIYAKLVDQPTPPQICHLCDQPVTARVCDPQLKKAPPTKGEIKTAALAARYAGAKDMPLEELEALEKSLYPEKHTETETQTAAAPQPAADYPNEGWHVIPGELKERLEGGLNDAT